MRARGRGRALSWSQGFSGPIQTRKDAGDRRVKKREIKSHDQEQGVLSEHKPPDQLSDRGPGEQWGKTGGLIIPPASQDFWEGPRS